MTISFIHVFFDAKRMIRIKIAAGDIVQIQTLVLATPGIKYPDYVRSVFTRKKKVIFFTRTYFTTCLA